MVLKCLGSSSRGNCYLLEAKNETLIIEAGVKISEIKKALNWKLSKVVGCLITHRHKDHSESLKEVLSCGIKVLALKDVFDSQPLKHKVFCKEVLPMHGYKVGGFKVFIMPVAHDVPCVGYIIEHQEMGKLLFITDTMMIEYQLPTLDHIMIEANYSDPILQVNINSGVVPASMKERLLHSHMELKTLKDILRVNDLTSVKELILLHLSGDSSNDEVFIREVRKSSGKPVYIAKSGFQINLSNTPY